MNIEVLSYELINQIAAGEVVERPLSVVKELVENSLDAGASRIAVEIKSGGIEYIRITDNGSGIPKDQVQKAFLQHATSKVRTFDDIMNVSSMGFRGEALSSIASVSKVELVTRVDGEETGTRLVLEGGEVISQKDVACPVGTTFHIRDLFYNTPARLKFLKKPATEGNYVSELMGRLALGHPDIAMTYVNNNETVLQTNGNGDLRTVIFYVLGKDVAAKLIRLKDDRDVDISGYIGRLDNTKANRTGGVVFVNGRYVKSPLLQSAVENAYRTMLMGGRFPVYVLNLAVDPAMVDVNVHPAKTEIRFRDEEGIYRAVTDAVYNTLSDEVLVADHRRAEPECNRTESERRSLTVAENKEVEVKSPFVPMEAERPRPIADIPLYVTEPKQAPQVSYKTANTIVFHEPPKEPSSPVISDPSVAPAPPAPPEEPFFSSYRLIGLAFGLYWIAEQGDRLYIIDQHACHERIMYETLRQNLQSGDIVSQGLIEPMDIRLGFSEYRVLTDNLETLEGFGFDIDVLGSNRVLVRAVPIAVSKPLGEDFLHDILDKIERIPANTADIHDYLVHSIARIACRAAVKANDFLSEDEARAMITRALALKNPFTCPHGRPTIIEITQSELNRRFKRT